MGRVVRFSMQSDEELTMIELQGVLESPTGSLEGQTLGKFQLSNGGKDATLIVGSHELHGKQVALAKPLVATRRTADGSQGVVGIVRHKYVFKTRPVHVKG